MVLNNSKSLVNINVLNESTLTAKLSYSVTTGLLEYILIPVMHGLIPEVQN